MHNPALTDHCFFLIKHEVREGYKALLEDYDTYLGLDTKCVYAFLVIVFTVIQFHRVFHKKHFTQPENQKVFKRLTTGVTTLDLKISVIQVRGN